MKWILFIISVAIVIIMVEAGRAYPGAAYPIMIVGVLLVGALILWAIFQKYGSLFFWLLAFELAVGFLSIFHFWIHERNVLDNIGPTIAAWSIALLTAVIYAIKTKNTRNLLLAGAVLCLLVSVVGIYLTR